MRLFSEHIIPGLHLALSSMNKQEIAWVKMINVEENKEQIVYYKIIVEDFKNPNKSL